MGAWECSSSYDVQTGYWLVYDTCLNTYGMILEHWSGSMMRDDTKKWMLHTRCIIRRRQQQPQPAAMGAEPDVYLHNLHQKCCTSISNIKQQYLKCDYAWFWVVLCLYVLIVVLCLHLVLYCLRHPPRRGRTHFVIFFRFFLFRFLSFIECVCVVPVASSTMPWHCVAYWAAAMPAVILLCRWCWCCYRFLVRER